MCGIALPLALLVPDGGQACADIRWYCKDAKSCTDRWTTARPPGHPPAPAVPGGWTAGWNRQHLSADGNDASPASARFMYQGRRSVRLSGEPEVAVTPESPDLTICMNARGG
jgi:hypothetical protein